MKPTLTRDAILEQALALDPVDRAFVAEELERSLPESAFGSATIAAAWSEEIDRRVAAHDRGDSTILELDQALDQVRQVLKEHRSQRQQS